MKLATFWKTRAETVEGPRTVKETMQFVLDHGYLVLMACVFGEQIGLPIHSAPLFLAVGALAASGRLSLTASLVLAVAASLVADLIWYERGRRRGSAVLSLICRASLSTCTAGTAQKAFQRHRAGILVYSQEITSAARYPVSACGIAVSSALSPDGPRPRSARR